MVHITERLHVEPRPGGAAFKEEGAQEVFVPEGTPVSMNLWAFRHGILEEMKKQFVSFLNGRAKENPLKAEYYLPSVPDTLIREGRAQVQVLDTCERWYGITYQQDLPAVQQALAAKRAAGDYPENLWD